MNPFSTKNPNIITKTANQSIKMHSSTESLDKSDTINITLKNKDANNSPSQNPEAITYILELNKGLLQENQKLIAKITQTEEDLKKKDEELEEKDDEIGREEKTNNHLKCLLKNFLEMSRLHQSISDERELISDKNYKSLKEFKTNMFSIRYSIRFCLRRELDAIVGQHLKNSAA